MSNSNSNDSGITTSSNGAADSDIIRETLTPIEIIDLVTPSILSISNDILSTSADITLNDHEVTINDSSSFANAPVKDCAANHHDTARCYAKKNDAATLMYPKKKMMLPHITLSWPLIINKLHAGCLPWNGYCEQDDSAFECVNTTALHHAIKNNTNAHHAEEHELMQNKR